MRDMISWKPVIILGIVFLILMVIVHGEVF